MATWTIAVFDEYFAPNLSKLTSAEIPDLDAAFVDTSRWVDHYVFNSIFDAGFVDPSKQLALAYLSRSIGSLDAYGSARRLTLEYIEHRAGPGGIDASKYSSAVSQWELFVLSLSIASDIRRALLGQDVFEKGDDSPQCRLYTVANQVKHIQSCLRRMDRDYPPVPLWLEDAGLVSFDSRVSYDEIAEVLTEYLHLAGRLRNPRNFAASTG